MTEVVAARAPASIDCWWALDSLDFAQYGAIVADGAHRALGTMLSLLSLTLGLATPSSGNQYLMRIELKQLLLSLGAVSDRGQFSSATEAA